MGDRMIAKGLKKERDGVYIDAQGRRVWDTEFFSGRGPVVEEESDEVEEEASSSANRKPINFKKHVGVSVTDGDVRSVGFYCKACNFRSKDSATFLDHKNSPYHLQNTGFPMQKKKATVDDIKEVLTKKRTRDEYDFDKRAKALQDEEEKEKEEKREIKKRKKEQKKKEEEEEFQGIDSDMAAIMGLPASFGSKK